MIAVRHNQVDVSMSPTRSLLIFGPLHVQRDPPVLAVGPMLLASVPAIFGLRLPKLVEQRCQFAGDRNLGALWPLCLGKTLSPDLQRTRTFEADKDRVGGFIKR